MHQAVLHYVVDEQVNVAGDALFVCELLHGLLDQVGLRVDEVSNVLDDLGVQLGELRLMLRHFVAESRHL